MSDKNNNNGKKDNQNYYLSVGIGIGLAFGAAFGVLFNNIAIGLVVVKKGKIIEKVHHLIKPKEMRFMPINIGIHGIRPHMVKDELEFDKFWEKIKHYFNDNLVIAHNASFDISVLRNTLELYDIKMPSFKYICTMKLSKNFYSNIDNARLNTVNNFLGYKFQHHDALADAMACSNILLNISQELNSKDINGQSIKFLNEEAFLKRCKGK